MASKLLLAHSIGSYRERVDGWSVRSKSQSRKQQRKGCYEKSSSFSLGPNSCCRTSSNSRLLFCSAEHKTCCCASVALYEISSQAHTRILLKYALCWCSTARTTPGGNSKEKATSQQRYIIYRNVVVESAHRYIERESEILLSSSRAWWLIILFANKTNCALSLFPLLIFL